MKLKKMLQTSAAVMAFSVCLVLGAGFTSYAAENETSMAATDYLNVRSGAGTGYRILGVLSPGEAVTVTGVSDGWYHVTYEGKPGYVYQKWLNFEGSSADGDVENGKETDMKSTVYLNVREQANTDSQILGVLSPGDKIQVTGKNGSWYKVKYEGKKAFVYADYLTFITEESGSTNSNGFEEREMTTTVGVNFRSGPSTDSKIIGGFAKGTVVTAIGAENGWYKVRHNGTEGYVSDAYLIDGKVNYAAEGETLTTTAAVNLRTSGSTSARVILTIPKGSKVKVNSSENGWYNVEYDGQAGFVYAQYVK